MQHLIIAIIVVLSFLLWRFPLFSISRRIVCQKTVVSYSLLFILFFLVPYTASLISFGLLGYENEQLSNIILLLALMIFAVSSIRSLVLRKTW